MRCGWPHHTTIGIRHKPPTFKRALTGAAPASQAVLVLPPLGRGRIRRKQLLAWLSKGRVSATEPPPDPFGAVLRAIGHTLPGDGLAALRFWGQTGKRSSAFVAAADPVYLEARLDHLRLHAFDADEIPRTQLRELCNHLQALVNEDDRYAFTRLGPHIYLRATVPFATATVPPHAVDGRDPGDFLPAGPHTATHDRLLSELQMALHDHEVNRRRAASGLRTVNSIWFWGGGIAPPMQVQTIPPLFADDPLFRGYWESCAGVARPWAALFDDALALPTGGFVAVAPSQMNGDAPAALHDCMEKLRRLVAGGDIGKLTMLGRDGIQIDIGRADAFRFWRRVSPLLRTADTDD